MSFDEFIGLIKDWGEVTKEIGAIILVGSYARGTPKSTSDIDLCILTSNKDKLLSSLNVFNRFGNPIKTSIEYYGAVTSIRIWYEDSYEVEYGITDMSWITMPLDNGTRQVLRDGFKVIVDKFNCFDEIGL